MIIRGWLLLPLLLVAAFCVVLYSPFILKRGWPEWAPGAGLGILPILGMYFAQTGTYTWEALVASVPSGFLVHNLLLLNEFPDVDADRTANRRTMPISLGANAASIIYSLVTAGVYVWIAGWVIVWLATSGSFGMPPWTLLGLLTLPLGIRAIRGSRRYDDMGRLVPAMADNVLVVLLTQFLMGVGYVLATAL